MAYCPGGTKNYDCYYGKFDFNLYDFLRIVSLSTKFLTLSPGARPSPPWCGGLWTSFILGLIIYIGYAVFMSANLGINPSSDTLAFHSSNDEFDYWNGVFIFIY